MNKVVRTEGDGIDNSILQVNEIETSNWDRANFSKESYNSILNSLKPVELKSSLIPLIPKYVPSEKKKTNYFIQKPKDPKFVPYEPYKAAVKSLKLTNPKNKKKLCTKVSKNDVEIQRLVGQVVDIRLSEMNKLDNNNEDLNDSSKLKLQWAKEKQALETDIRNLKETNCHLENQLKFQAQVIFFGPSLFRYYLFKFLGQW